MALIECEECKKSYSDTIESCPHCGFKRENKVQEENSVIEEYLKKFIADKKSVFSFICGIISLICSSIFFTEMNLSGIPFIFTAFLIVTSVINIIYSFNVVKKYNNDILLGGMAATFIGFLLRTVQLGVIASWQYFVAYYIFTLIMILLIYRFAQNKGNNTILNSLLIVAAIYDVFEFVNSGNSIMKGIYWRIYHIAEAALFINYIGILRMNKGNYEQFAESLGKYKKQIMSRKITISIVTFITIIAMSVGVIKQINNTSNSITNNNAQNENNDMSSSVSSTQNNSSNTSTQGNSIAKEEQEKQEYIDNYFKLLAGDVKYFEKSYTDDEWGLENIEVKNNGDKNVQSFKITVYFKDAEGNNIAENSFTVRESIKANYSWKLGSGSYYELKNLASEVDPSRNEIRITDIDFGN